MYYYNISDDLSTGSIYLMFSNLEIMFIPLFVLSWFL